LLFHQLYYASRLQRFFQVYNQDQNSSWSCRIIKFPKVRDTENARERADFL
jgi:hypothetical protein